MRYNERKFNIYFQTSEKRAIETKDITTSFGWDSNECKDNSYDVPMVQMYQWFKCTGGLNVLVV